MEALTNIYRRWFAPHSQAAGMPFSTLPRDVILEIFRYLSSYDLAQLGKTCRSFRALSNENTLMLAKRMLFKTKASIEKLDSATTFSWFNFYYDDTNKRLIQSIGDDKKLAIECKNLADNTTVSIFKNECVFHNELDDYWVFGYFRNSFFLQFLCKKTHRFFDPISFSHIPGADELKNITSDCGSGNTISFCIKDQIICVLDQKHIFQIPPLEFNDSTFANVEKYTLDQNSIIVTYLVHQEKKDYFLQVRYCLFEKRAVASRAIPRDGLLEPVSVTRISQDYIVTFFGLKNIPRSYIRVDVCDKNFNPIVKYNIDVAPTIPMDTHMTNLTYGKEPVLEVYRNRLMVLVNLDHLLFIELTTGRVLREHKIGIMQGEDTNCFRLTTIGENIFVYKKNLLQLYDFNTGNLLRTFRSPGTVQWVEFKTPCHLLFTCKARNKSYRAHLQVNNTIVKPKRKKKYRR